MDNIDLDNLRGQLHGNLGTFYFSAGIFDQARFHFKLAIKIFKRVGDPEDIAQFHRNIGLGSYRQQKYREAISELNKAVDAGTEESVSQIHILLLRGRTYRKMRKPEKAEKDHQLALELALSTDDKILINIAKREVAFDRFYLDDTKTAWTLLEESVLKRRLPFEPDSVFKLEDTIDIGLMAQKSGEDAVAIRYFNKAKKLIKRLNRQYQRILGEQQTPELAYIDSLYESIKPHI